MKVKQMQDAKLKEKVKSSAHKNKSLSATLPGNGARKVLDKPQEQGIIVEPLNVEVRYRSAGARRKSYLFSTTKVSQVLVDYALNKLNNLWRLI
jgi:hypothetical protein